MAREIMTDDMVNQELARLLASPHVKLAKREETIRNRKRQYLYKLRGYEKRGKVLEAQGVTLEELEEIGAMLYDGE